MLEALFDFDDVGMLTDLVEDPDLAHHDFIDCHVGPGKLHLLYGDHFVGTELNGFENLGVGAVADNG